MRVTIMSNNQINNNQAQATVLVKIIKRNGAENISFNKNVFTSITGTAIECDFVQKGEQLGSYVLESRTTICFTHETAAELLEVTKEIFDLRTATGDKNPIIYLRVEAKKISPANGSFLVLDVTSVQIEEQVAEEVAFDVNQFKMAAATIKQVSQEATEESLARAAAARQARNEATSQMLQRVTSIVRRSI